MKQGQNKKSPARSVALVGIMAAAVECVKLAIAAIPNVEAVTLLLALFGYCSGWLGVASAFVFVMIEPLIWGFNTWVISYFLYWPFVAFVFMLLRKRGVKNRWLLTLVAVLLTFWFGVLTSLVDVGLFSGSYDSFFLRFGIYYARGIVFYAIQIACNAILFPVLFSFLSDKLARVNKN